MTSKPRLTYWGQKKLKVLQNSAEDNIRIKKRQTGRRMKLFASFVEVFNPYPTAFPYGNGMVLHFYQQQESSTTKTVHKVINKGLKAYV